MAKRLNEKVTIITGAARGIGRAAAILFAQEGACVSIADLDEVRGEETASFIRLNGGQAKFFKTDLVESDQV
ncbi:MAG: SDR family NAD(P)-dependent oxidoreductase, partial [Anaerolineaceae bacterium]